MQHEVVAIIVGNEDGQHVAIRLMSRSDPTQTDFWDGNWINSEVEVAVGAFRGRYRAGLRANDFPRFRDEVATLYESLEGAATFRTLESQLELTLKGNGMGHVALSGVARDDAQFPNTLRFELALDQTQLPLVLRGLDQALVRFPVVGRPGS